MDLNFKPWGKLEWLLSKINNYQYSFYGCLSTEDRSLEAFKIILNSNLFNHKFLEVIDPEPWDTIIHQENRKKIKEELQKQFSNVIIESYDLLCPIDNVQRSISSFIANSNGNILLDISSFPKRFFFPIIKVLLRSSKVNTLIITYTTPNQYSSRDLSENPLDWSHIPMFDSDDPDIKFDLALVGLGFMPLGLSNLFKDKFSNLDVKLMFPFPPGPPSYQRTWNFIEEMQQFPKVNYQEMIRVNGLNMPDTFDLICSLTRSKNRSILLAPYGPKTMSLAMCLYACLSNSPVYYTQPTSYDSKYSEGVSDCYGYCIKLNGRSFFKI